MTTDEHHIIKEAKTGEDKVKIFTNKPKKSTKTK